MDSSKIKDIVEAALLAAGRPLSVDDLQAVFGDFSRPDRGRIREAVAALQEDYADRAMEIKQVASGYRVQVRTRFTEFISRLWEEKPPRYSRALMETLALIAYRQPITRGEIEEVRGVSVSTNIVRTLMERNWVRVVGHRDVPGRPAMFGTTKEFLDYFGLRKLDDLPSLKALQDIEDLSVQLPLPTDEEQADATPASESSGAEVGLAETESGEPMETAADEPDDEGETSDDAGTADRPAEAPRMHLVSSSADAEDTDTDKAETAEIVSGS